MRERLSELLVATATTDERFIVLSGDHGYALFDDLRAKRPNQFLNVGVAEQNMIGVAAGLAKVGFRPCVYGLAAFIPMRVLEQIKLDLCHAKAPVILLGDGAGLVYSTLGVSHQCGEDVACLRPLPNISIFSPSDARELEACWNDALKSRHPVYLRIGKSDRPPVHFTNLQDTEPHWTYSPNNDDFSRLIVATGSMTSVASTAARTLAIPCLSVPRIHPLPDAIVAHASAYAHVAVIEEHSLSGGLFGAIAEAVVASRLVERPVSLQHFGLASRFTSSAGCYDHALSEHAIDNVILLKRLEEWSSRRQLNPPNSVT